MPVKTGIQEFLRPFWIPVCAGMTETGVNFPLTNSET